MPLDQAARGPTAPGRPAVPGPAGASASAESSIGPPSSAIELSSSAARSPLPPPSSSAWCSPSRHRRRTPARSNGSRRRQRHRPQTRPTGWATRRTAWEFNTTFRDRFATRSARPHRVPTTTGPAWVRSSRASSGRTTASARQTGSTTSSTALSSSSIEATVRARRLRARRHSAASSTRSLPARSANYRPAGCRRSSPGSTR